MRYSVYTRRNGASVGWENSQITRRPPGLITRLNSSRATMRSATFRNPKEIVTRSKLESPNGRASASAATKGIAGFRALPTSSIPSEKSAAMTSAPEAVNAADEVPVPAAMSRTSCPSSSCKALRTALRQRRVCPTARMSLVRSYLAATASNIAATSAGSLSKFALGTPLVCQRSRLTLTAVPSG